MASRVTTENSLEDLKETNSDLAKIQCIHMKLCIMSGINPLSDKGKKLFEKVVELYKSGMNKEREKKEYQEKPHVVY